MKDKFSDNILNTDSVPERNQEPTETGKIKLLDVVVLTQDIPEHNLKRREKSPDAQCLIKAMEKPSHLTHEDIESLNQSIKEGQVPIKFDIPFDSDEPEKE